MISALTRRPLIFPIIAFGAIVLTKLIFFLDHLALSGFSPIGWIAKLNHPENFVNDFPTGIENFDLSLFMQTYRFLNALDIPATWSVFLVVILEGAFFFTAIVHLCKSLLGAEIDKWSAALFALVLLSQTAVLSFAQFSFPFFYGQFYVPADSMRLLAISFAIRRNYAPSLLCIFLALSFHPVIGLTGALFMVPLLLKDFARVFRPRTISIGLGATVLCGLFLKLKMARLEGQAVVPAEDFLRFTRLLNEHLYPVSSGLFTSAVADVFVPFMSLALIAWYCYKQLPANEHRNHLNRLGPSLVVTAAVVALGILFSEASQSPTLIKLSLHRASSLISFFALWIVVHSLVRRLIAGAVRNLSTFFLLLFVTSVFMSVHPYTLMVGALFVFFDGRERALSLRQMDRIWIIGFVSLLAYLGVIAAMGHPLKWKNPAYLFPFGLKFREILTLIVVLILWRIIIADRLKRQALVVVGIGFSVMFLGHLYFKFTPRLDEHLRGQSYRESQLWARDRSDPKALFMVDPTISYGWRDFSERSSFGSYREWLMVSWLYDSSLKTYSSGMERFSEFDNIGDYADDLKNGEGRIVEMVRTEYYDLASGLHHRLSTKYGINYFVFDNRFLTKGTLPKPIFSNRYFSIVTADSFRN
jgi:hypothetical protein